MLLNAQNLMIAELASSDETRSNLNGLYVCPLVTVATDGHCLGAITTPTDDPHDFPAIGGITGDEAPPPPAIVPRSACRDALKAIPKKTHQPILRHVYVTGENGTRRLLATDVDTVHPIETKTGDGAKFPDWQACIPQTVPTFTIAVNPALLAKVCTTAAKLGAKAIKLELRDPTSPMVATATLPETGQSALFLVMPVRL
jgi:DNA polymerase III sliding clamp (beta) subunit (PCNA family)